VMRLKPVTFRYTPEYRAMEGGLADKAYAGFIAQEFAEVFPESVLVTDKAVPGAARGEQNILALDPNPALITTVAAVQELATENVQLHHQIDELSARLSRLESRGGN
jgi:Chaperone of endosialidase